MKKKKNKPVILIYILILILLYITIYIFPRLSSALQPTYNITYGEMKLSDITTGYVVRNEKLYLTSRGGETNYYIKEGDLLRTGSTVMDVAGNTDSEMSSRYGAIVERVGGKALKTGSYSVEEGGIVCYFADGYEGKLTPQNMKKKKYEFYQQLKQKDVISLKRDTVNSGEPVFKIVDRTNWYMVCYIPKDHREHYEVDMNLSVELDGTTLKTKVYSIQNEGENCKIILTTDHLYGKFGEARVIDDVEIITYRQRGLLVENKSIVEENGQKGVYVQDKIGNVSFVPIQIIQSNDEMSLVSDGKYYDEKGKEHFTVEIYDVVLRNPQKQ